MTGDGGTGSNTSMNSNEVQATRIIYRPNPINFFRGPKRPDEIDFSPGLDFATWAASVRTYCHKQIFSDIGKIIVAKNFLDPKFGSKSNKQNASKDESGKESITLLNEVYDTVFVREAFDCLTITSNQQTQEDNRIYIKGKLQGHEVKLLIDSGAQANLTRKELVNKLNLQMKETNKSLTGVTGYDLQIFGNSNYNILLSDKDMINIDGFVVSDF